MPSKTAITLIFHLVTGETSEFSVMIFNCKTGKLKHKHEFKAFSGKERLNELSAKFIESDDVKVFKRNEEQYYRISEINTSELQNAVVPIENLKKYNTKKAEFCERQIRVHLHQVSKE